MHVLPSPGSQHMSRRTTPLVRAAIWLGLRPTPLRRRVDRIEVAARWLAVIIGLGAVALAPVAADAVSSSLTTSAATTRGGQYATSATALEEAGTSWAPEMMPAMRNAHGQPVTTTLTASDIGALGAGTGLVVPLLGVGTGRLVLSTTRRLLQGPRQRYWDHAWMAFNRDQISPGR
jgi:hypothetical protein